MTLEQKAMEATGTSSHQQAPEATTNKSMCLNVSGVDSSEMVPAPVIEVTTAAARLHEDWPLLTTCSK
jgi:hypothetical protein